MKKLVLLTIILLMMFTIASCTRGENNNMTSTEPYEPYLVGVGPDGEIIHVPIYEPPEPPPSFTVPDGMEAEEFVLQAWERRVENILRAEITRVEHISRFRPFSEPVVSFSEDSLIIERWKALLPRLRLSVIPLEILIGAHAITLTFYEEDTPLQLLSGHPAPDILHIAEGRIGEDWTTSKRFRIENFDEVGEEFMALLREMGVTTWDPVYYEGGASNETRINHNNEHLFCGKHITYFHNSIVTRP